MVKGYDVILDECMKKASCPTTGVEISKKIGKERVGLRSE